MEIVRSEADQPRAEAAGRWWHKRGVFINTASDAANLLAPLFASSVGEKVVAAHLDADQRLLATIESGGGGHGAVELPIRAIIEDAFRLGSAGLIVAHNHPSGDPRPSQADLAATRELAATAESLGIHFHDHLIVCQNGDCRSFRALGLL